MKLRQLYFGVAVPFVIALLLTFDRNGFIPYTGRLTLIDHLSNYLVISIAFIGFFVSLKVKFYHKIEKLIYFIPFFILFIHLLIHVTIADSNVRPHPSGSISLFIGIFFVLQLYPKYVKNVRSVIVFIAAIFNLSVALFGFQELREALTVDQATRLGVDISSANVIIFPRALYLVILACIVTALTDGRKGLKLFSLCLIPLPFIIALATGGRGPLVGFLVSLLVFLITYYRLRPSAFIKLTILAYLIYWALDTVVEQYFPLMSDRLYLAKEGNERVDVWNEILSGSLSFFGYGISSNYAHNIFLELAHDYGVFGLVAFVVLLINSLRTSLRNIYFYRSIEANFLMSVLMLQMVAQQFSLNVYYPAFWISLLLPLTMVGFSKTERFDKSSKIPT